MKKAVFIDTNVFLGLYEFSNDDLHKLEQLEQSLEKKSINLCLTTQVEDEFNRNRETRINKALSALNNAKLKFKIPTLAKNFADDYAKLIKTRKECEQIHNLLSKKLKESALASTLKADEIMNTIFSSENTRKFKHDDNIFSRAQIRMRLGNPPGKKNDICDSLNWELLLENLQSGTELIIISDDGDYSSQLDESKMHSFLTKEWHSKKGTTVELFKSLTDFFKKYIPDLKLKDEERTKTNDVISRLEQSGNFESTHRVISLLNDSIANLDSHQIDRIADACLENTQINWILTDSDVKKFVENFIGTYGSQINEEKLERLKLDLIDE